MSGLTGSEIRTALEEVIRPDDRVVVVYSGIWTFGHRIAGDRRRLPFVLLDALLECCGSDRTLVLPTYTNSFARTRRYDPVNSLPETGILPTTFLRHYQAARSLSAMNSFAALGPDSAAIARLKGDSLWGRGSVKEYLEQRNARVVMLGVTWPLACGFLHRMEEVAQVPYRYYKRFRGVRVEGGRETPWTETMFVRPLPCPLMYRWGLVVDRLKAKGLVLQGVPQLCLESALARDITGTGCDLLAADPFALVVNEAEVRDWVRHTKAAEVQALGPDAPEPSGDAG